MYFEVLLFVIIHSKTKRNLIYNVYYVIYYVCNFCYYKSFLHIYINIYSIYIFFFLGIL